MNQSAGGPSSDPKAVHERIAKALVAQSNPLHKTIEEIPVYARRHLPEHAAAGGSMNERIINDAILPYLDVAALKEAAASVELPFMPLVRKAAHAWSWEHPSRNAAALRFIAAAEGYRSGSRDDPLTPWRVRWASPLGASEILARTGSLVSLAAVPLDSGIVVITASRPGRIEVWDLATGQSMELLDEHQLAGVSTLAAEPAPDGSAFVSAASPRGLVRCWQIWRETDAQRVVRLKYQPMRSLDLGNPVTALCLSVINDRPHVLAGHANGCISLFDRVSPQDERQRPPRPAEIHQGRVTGIACVRLSNGTPAAVSVSAYGTLRVSSLLSRLAPVGPLAHPGGTIRAVAAVRFPDGTPAVVTAGEGGSVSIWDLPPEDLRPRKVPGHDRDVVALSAGTGPAGEPLVVTGDSGGRLRFVDPVLSAVLGGSVEDRQGGVAGLALAAAPHGRSVLVSGDGDGTVRTWDLAGLLSGDRLSPGGPTGPDAAPPAERPVRVWRLDDGAEIGGGVGARSHRMVAVAVGRLSDGTEVTVTDPGAAPRVSGRSGPVVAVATAVLPDGRPVVVTADDEHLQFWELSASLAPLGPPLAHPGARLVATAIGADGRPVAVSAGRDHKLRIWDIQDGHRLADGDAGHDKSVTALATVAVAGRRPAVVLSGSADTTLRVWGVDSGQRIGPVVHGDGRQIAAVAGVYTDDGLIAVTACAGDPVVRKLGLLGADAGPPRLVGHQGPVTAVAVGGPADRPVVVTASEDRTVRVWDLMSSTQVVDPMPVPGTVRAIACFDADGPSAVIAGDDVLAVVHWDGRDQVNAGGRHRTPSPARPEAGPGVTLHGGQGVIIGTGNVQHNYYYYGDRPQDDDGDA